MSLFCWAQNLGGTTRRCQRLPRGTPCRLCAPRVDPAGRVPSLRPSPWTVVLASPPEPPGSWRSSVTIRDRQRGRGVKKQKEVPEPGLDGLPFLPPRPRPRPSRGLGTPPALRHPGGARAPGASPWVPVAPRCPPRLICHSGSLTLLPGVPSGGQYVPSPCPIGENALLRVVLSGAGQGPCAGTLIQVTQAVDRAPPREGTGWAQAGLGIGGQRTGRRRLQG